MVKPLVSIKNISSVRIIVTLGEQLFNGKERKNFLDAIIGIAFYKSTVFG